MSRIHPSDASYPVDAMMAVLGVKEWLNEEETGKESSVERLHRLLQIMASETPFRPGGKFSRYESPTLISEDEEFKYRRPVWKLIAHEIVVTDAIKPFSSKEKAIWLYDQLGLCVQYKQYKEALEIFRKKVNSLGGLSFQTFSYEGTLDTDVLVLGTFPERGENTIRETKKIINALSLALTQHVENISRR